jgi:pseudouridine-5'-phosphate glycosidase
VTPWLLARVAEITHGASVKANIALIVNNARVAGELAGALSG